MLPTWKALIWDPKWAFRRGGDIHEAFQAYRAQGKKLHTTAYRVHPPKGASGEEYTFYIVDRCRRFVELGHQVYKALFPPDQTAAPTAQNLDILLQRAKDVGPTMSKMFLVTAHLLFPEKHLLDHECQVGEGAAAAYCYLFPAVAKQKQLEKLNQTSKKASAAAAPRTSPYFSPGQPQPRSPPNFSKRPLSNCVKIKSPCQKRPKVDRRSHQTAANAETRRSESKLFWACKRQEPKPQFQLRSPEATKSRHKSVLTFKLAGQTISKSAAAANKLQPKPAVIFKIGGEKIPGPAIAYSGVLPATKQSGSSKGSPKKQFNSPKQPSAPKINYFRAVFDYISENMDTLEPRLGPAIRWVALRSRKHFHGQLAPGALASHLTPFDFQVGLCEWRKFRQMQERTCTRVTKNTNKLQFHSEN
mmetsp:Transcript_13806/g.19675  ORF Transcript_13806/g.19675 Transcript_13806/m.19675 type:complete len:416 (-) Transcript_13806:162-1409(-)